MSTAVAIIEAELQRTAESWITHEGRAADILSALEHAGFVVVDQERFRESVQAASGSGQQDRLAVARSDQHERLAVARSEQQERRDVSRSEKHERRAVARSDQQDGGQPTWAAH